MDNDSTDVEQRFRRAEDAALDSIASHLGQLGAVGPSAARCDTTFFFHDRCYHVTARVRYQTDGGVRVEVFNRFVSEAFIVVDDASESTIERKENDVELETERGTITGVVNAGTITQVFIATEGGVVVVAADGNLWHRAESDYVATNDADSLIGAEVEFVRNNWGGLESFLPVDE